MIARCRVLASRPETPSIHSIHIERPPGFHYAPVQFCGLEIETEEGPIEYSMSLASSPTQEHLEFGARMSTTPWKRAFQALRPGDEVEIDGPYGHFVLDERRDAVFVAGGIGITPLKGMLRYAADRALPIRTTLVYSNKVPSEIGYRNEIEETVARNPRARVFHTMTQASPSEPWTGRTGRIDTVLLREASEGLSDPTYYLCGKPGMVKGAAIMLLREMGVARERVVAEQFWGYE